MFCNKCGKELDPNAKFCNYCGTNSNNVQKVSNINAHVKVKKKIYQQWWFWLLIVLLVLMIGAMNSGESKNKQASANNVDSNEIISTNKEPTISKDEYKKLCKKYDYKELARNPNKYKGSKVKFTGEVIQVQEGWLNSVTLRVNVTKGEYGYWEDTIWVDYTYENENESKILEDDIIDIYGEFKGQKTYTSVLGSSVSIPQIEAKYISLNKDK